MAECARTPQFHGENPTEILDSPNSTVFAFLRAAPGEPLVALFNFSERAQAVTESLVVEAGVVTPFDVLTKTPMTALGGEIWLPAFGFLWLVQS